MLITESLPAYAGIMNGLTQSTAAVSAKQLQNDYPASSSGIYWIDPTYGSTSDAFQAFLDMTTNGGGWVQAIHSAVGNEAPTSDIISNTGSLSGGYTRAVGSLAVTTTAEIRHVIQFSGGAKFHGKYTGKFHDPLPTLGSWTFLSGHTSGIESQLSPNFGQPWSAVTAFGAPWYTLGGGLTGVIPSTPFDGLTGGPFNSSGLGVVSYDVFIRELLTPTGNFDPIADLLDSTVNLTPGLNSDTLILNVAGSFDNDDQIVRYEFDLTNDGSYDLVLDVGSPAFLQYWDGINSRFLIPESLSGPFNDFREMYPPVNGGGFGSLAFTAGLRVTDANGVTATDTATITFVPEVGSWLLGCVVLLGFAGVRLARRRMA